MGRIFHIATATDWQAAKKSGSYTTSTLGRTLAEEGFIHASRGDQWAQVREQFYADVNEPLVLLVIEADLLDVPVVEEEVPGTSETFPHIYGPLRPDAVVQVVPVEVALAGSVRSFSSLFLAEVLRNAMLGALLMGCVVAGTLTGRAIDPSVGTWLGLLAGLIAGIAAVLARSRRTTG